MKRESPCMCCTRVANPSSCENKNCSQWQSWFTACWDAACSRLRQALSEKEVG